MPFLLNRETNVIINFNSASVF